MQGILLVDKPKTWTSFDAVNYVRRIVATHEEKKPKNVKVGHIGTLDPLATGLLVLLVGKDYTRRAAELSKLDKTYDVTMKLGETSATADDEGEKTKQSDMQPDPNDVSRVILGFQGESLQTPPIFSAMKVNGQRAYKLARAGKEVQLEPRPIKITKITLIDYTYPYVRFTAEVSSGTYIRSLVEDIGKQLETGAYMSDLRRTAIADFSLQEAVAVKSLSAETIAEHLRQL